MAACIHVAPDQTFLCSTVDISLMTQHDEKIVCRSTENNEITNVLSALYQFSRIMKTNKLAAPSALVGREAHACCMLPCHLHSACISGA